MTIDINALALVLAQAAEAEIRPRFRALGKGDIRTKADANDLVTAADEAAVLPMPCDGRAPLAHDGRVVPAAPLPAPVPPGQEAPLAMA